MAQMANASSGRALALARRRAMSVGGKAAVKSAPRPTSGGAPARAKPVVASRAGVSAPVASGRAASVARRRQMSAHGKSGIVTTDRTRVEARTSNSGVNKPVEKKEGCDCGCMKPGTEARAAIRSERNASVNAATSNRLSSRKRAKVNANPGRCASLARRQALSSRGKAGISANGMSAAQTARASNPDLSGRELAQVLRQQRSRNGAGGQQKPTRDCSGQRRQRKKAEPAPAADASWKVGASETTQGQTVTGTMVGRSVDVTGDEPSTCRSITGTEYMGADIFRQFCQTDPLSPPKKVRLSPTARGNVTTGSKVGRSAKMTGNEPGTCKNVTGTDYISADQSEIYCGGPAQPGPAKITGASTRSGKLVTGNNVGRSANVTGDETGAQRELTGSQYMQQGNGEAPAKVGVSQTLRGGHVTGVMVGRSQRVTGDEPGSCRDITGDDYVGKEQYGEFCGATPAPKDEKSGISQTMMRKHVTGTMTGRSNAVTGDEPGTCKAVTGTPYAGLEQYKAFCEGGAEKSAQARSYSGSKAASSQMTGIRPAVGGVMTGDDKGMCESVTGTPYVAADQQAAACPATPAQANSSDFPQPIDGTQWGEFSVEAPNHAIKGMNVADKAVTGSAYEKGHITGPFGMASGKVTGTEEARFGAGVSVEPASAVAAAASDTQRVKSRITGEGQNAGLRITGDDWSRNERVTGTEGASTQSRNPTRAGGPMSVMAPLQKQRRNEDLPEPTSLITGSSGSTTAGSLITYSGGARG